MEVREQGGQAAARRVHLLRPRPRRRGADYIRYYHGYFGGYEGEMARSIPSSPETIRDLMRAFEDIGADELVCWPTVAELDRVDRLADLVG